MGMRVIIPDGEFLGLMVEHGILPGHQRLDLFGQRPITIGALGGKELKHPFCVRADGPGFLFYQCKAVADDHVVFLTQAVEQGVYRDTIHGKKGPVCTAADQSVPAGQFFLLCLELLLCFNMPEFLGDTVFISLSIVIEDPPDDGPVLFQTSLPGINPMLPN